MRTRPAGVHPLSPEDPRRIGPYKPVGRVGSGGMGTVFAARHRNTYIAVKTIHSEHTSEPGFRVRFAREVALLERVRSPYVPALIAAGPDAPVPWLATEYVPGTTLHRHIKEHGPLPAAQLRALAAGVAEALRDIHAVGIAHRDLKPGNVILTANGPRVVDFGIARAAEDTTVTALGGIVGTPGWISPEQYEGHQATTSSDVFAWGGLIAFAGTGRGPFGYGAANVLAYRTLADPPDLIGLDAALAPLVESAMAKAPSERPRAAELVHSMHEPRPTGRPTAAPPGEHPPHVWAGIGTAHPTGPAPSHGRRTLVTGAAVAALLLAVGAAVPTALGTAPWSAGTTAPDGARPAADGSAGRPGRSAGAAPEAPLPPGATDQAVNGPDQSRVRITDGHPRIEANSGPRTGYSVTFTSVRPVSGGIGFTATVEFANASPRVASDQFSVSSNGTTITADSPFTVDAADGSSKEEVDLVFPDAPESGMVTFVGDPYEEGVRGNPPVSFCYDADGSFSLDYPDCVDNGAR